MIWNYLNYFIENMLPMFLHGLWIIEHSHYEIIRDADITLSGHAFNEGDM